MTTITRDPIDIERIRKEAHHPKAGAMLLFCGDIRNHSEGKAVVHLEYEAHPTMADRQISDIVEEAKKRWEIHHVEVLHRFGKMEVLECSIAIAVATSHRKDCYAASRFIIDAIKHSVPIWKKEFFVDGSSEWSKGCEACGIHEDGADAHHEEGAHVHHHDHASH